MGILSFEAEVLRRIGNPEGPTPTEALNRELGSRILVGPQFNDSDNTADKGYYFGFDGQPHPTRRAAQIGSEQYWPGYR